MGVVMVRGMEGEGGFEELVRGVVMVVVNGEGDVV